MELRDSRRLTGAGLLLDREGAVLEVSFTPEEKDRILELWRKRTRQLLDAVGWNQETIAVREFPGGASLALSAPFDALYAACDLAEAAWSAATAAFQGEPEPDFAEARAQISAAIEAEREPEVASLREAAQAHGVSFLIDDHEVTVGLGAGSRTFLRRPPSPPSDLPEGAEEAARDLPQVSAEPLEAPVDWSRVHDIPHAIVTGTNGKTTTVRLLASIGRAAGFVVGLSSTDGVVVGGEKVAAGDYSGPEGARKALRDSRVELAVLELARGGLLRRGVPLQRAAAAAVTNVAADHLGEYGILDVPHLAEAKITVARTLRPGGRLVLNADDPELAARGAAVAERFGLELAWFSLSQETDPLATHLRQGGIAAFVERDALVLAHGLDRIDVIHIADFPLAHGGAARHNLANALTAILLASALHLSPEAMREGLAALASSPADNPGRANRIALPNGATVLLDYAHNPHGLEALRPLVESFPAKRRILLLGQAGDRDDTSLAALAASAARFAPDLVILKEMPAYLRGRQPGEIPALLEAELRRAGITAIEHAGTELEGVERALALSEEGDLLILLIHTDRARVFERLGV